MEVVRTDGVEAVLQRIDKGDGGRQGVKEEG